MTPFARRGGCEMLWNPRVSLSGTHPYSRDTFLRSAGILFEGSRCRVESAGMELTVLKWVPESLFALMQLAAVEIKASYSDGLFSAQVN